MSEQPYDCEKLKGRLRDLCRGYDRHGVPVDVSPRQLAAYQEYFRSGEFDRKQEELRNESKLTRAEKEAARIEKSHKAWRQLHGYATDHAHDWNTDAAKAWLTEWEKLIPSYGCRCKEEWAAIKRRLPPNFTSAEAFYQWTTDAHNEVNKLLNKPTWKPS